MAARTYGNTRGSAEAQGATVGEDRLYSVLQALKETGTEYMFAGAGLASKLTGAGAALEKTGLGALKSTALDRLEELKVVKDVLKGIRHEIVEGQETYLNGQKKTFNELSDNICDEFESMIKKYGEAKKFKGAYGLVRDFVNFDNVTPMSFFKNAGGTFSHIWDVLRNSQDKYFQYTKETAEFVETLPGNKRWLRLNGGHSDAQKWQDHRNEIELESGKKIDVSDTQIMSLYLLAKRKAAIRHIYGEGIRVPVINKDTRKVREKVADKVLMRDMTDYETVAVTEADLADMFALLTPQQKKFANAMQDYLSTVIAERGNKASMEMYGVRLFEEEKYFPMYTVQDGKFKNLETGYNGIAGIPDPGWSKNVNEKAENALVIEDCIRVFTSYFGYRNAPTAGASSNHPAIDIAVPEGTRVSASDGGTVVATGWSGGYGNIVQIDHGNGVVTQYSHLSKVGVRKGQKVARGQEVARSGNTGVSTGPHLDFKMMINGEPVDPLKHLTK